MTASSAIPLVLIPALLCDDALYRDVVGALGPLVDAEVVIAARPVMAESVAEILARAPERFVLGGSSYGGTVALEVALAAPDRVIALWLSGCDAGAADRDATLGLAGFLEASPDAAIDQLAGVVVRPDAPASAATFRAMAGRVGGQVGGAQARALAGRADAWDRLGGLRMPAQVVWGDEDAAIPHAVGERLASTLLHAALHTIAGCGHLPALERPRDVAALVRSWLQQQTMD